MSRIAATLLVALGDFGAEVSARLRARLRTRAEERRPDLAIVEVSFDEDGAALTPEQLHHVEVRLIEEVTSQLALGALVNRAPAETSLPWLDVFLVGDLAAPSVRASLAELIDRVEQVVAARFGNLLGHGAARLVVMPLLAISESVDPAAPGHSLVEVGERLAQRKTPRVRTFLFESQTSHYILSRDELLVLAELREGEQLAPFLRGEPPAAGRSADPAPFGAFGVASVHVDRDLLRSYCRNRAGLTIVEAMRAGADIGLEEREERARSLRLSWDDVRERLGLAAQSDAAFEQVEQIVLEEAPRLPCPEIDPLDTPEEIRERKFGDDWYRAVGPAIDQLIERLERRRMHELSSKIDAGGLTIARHRRQQLRETVDEWLWQAPRGWSTARSVLTLLRDEVAATQEEATRRIARISLPVLPTPEQLHRPVIALREESERRPRRFRLWLTGALLSLVGIVFGYMLLALLQYPLNALDAPRWLIDAISPPYGLILTTLIVVPFVALSLRSMVRRRHEELCEVRADLKRSLDRLITGKSGSVLSYYLARLELARELWVLRLATLDRRLMEEELTRLDEIQRALDTLWDQLRASQRSLGVRYRDDTTAVEDLSSIKPGGDLILREAADGQLLQTTYAMAARDEEDLPTQYFDLLKRARPKWRLELPMAERQRIDRFLDETLELPHPGELLGAEGVASAAARRAVERAFTDLLTRLTPSLGLTEASTGSPSSWVIWSPATAMTIVDDALETLRDQLELAGLGTSWLRLTSPRDDGRVYLAAFVTQLPLSAIGALRR